MNILVTGGAGYLGSTLVPQLLARGHRVRVLDIGYFGLDHMRSLGPAVSVIEGDIRGVAANGQLRVEAFDEVDAVVHLAAISDDQSGELDPRATQTVNCDATAVLAEIARAKGVRFIFSSSCAVYGGASQEVDESSALDPLSAYARSKMDAERALGELADGTWSPVVLRNGTLFGYSPRMRFDVVVNIFCLQSVREREVRVFGEGEQWRPYITVSDCAKGFVHFLETTGHRHSTYNLVRQNLRVVDLATVFHHIDPDVRITHVPVDVEDKRSYAVSARRAADDGFEPHGELAEGARTVIDALTTGLIADPDSPIHRNAQWMKIGSQSSQGAPAAELTSLAVGE